MAFTVNQVVLCGNLGRDAEIKFTPNGNQVANFSIATSWGKKKADGTYENITDWHNCILWSQEKVAALLLKGTKVTVTGRLSQRSYDNKDGKKTYVTEVVCNDVIICNGSGSSAAGGGYDGGGDQDGQPF